MARPQTATDQQILDAAREVFTEEGERATVASIAARVGITHAAIHQRFGTKRELFLRAMCPAGPPHRVMAMLQRGPLPGSSPHEQLRPMLVGLLAFLRDGLPQLLALRAAGAELVPEASESMPARLRLALAAWLSAADHAGLATVPVPAAVAEALLGALEAKALNEHLGAATAADDHAYFDLMLRGLVPATESTPETPDVPSQE